MSKVRKVLIAFILGGLLLTAAAFLLKVFINNKPATSYIIDSVVLKSVEEYNIKAVDTAVSLLKSGYIVLRMGQGADSYLLAQLNQKNKSFSHCGIVFIENGYPFVYHSIGGEDNPDEILRRDSANFFFSPKHNLALAIIQYDFNLQCINQLENIVIEYYNKKPKFDLQFDLKTDDKLYCAEFVYKALNKAMNDTGYIKTTTLLGCTFVGIDNLFLNNHANIIWQTKFK